jgi:hypothetical protein
MGKSFKIVFTGELTADATLVRGAGELPGALREIGLQDSRPTLVLVGGAAGLRQTHLDHLRPFFVDRLVPLAQELGASVVDGGTDTGVMRLMGQGRAEAGGDFPLIGVAALGTVTFPGANLSQPWAIPLEPHHTHFLLVPGFRWGDESPWLSRTAKALARRAPSVTILVNGGATAWEDVSQSVRAKRPVVVIGGTGRVADILAATLASQDGEGQARELAASGLLRVIQFSEPFAALRTVIEEFFPRNSENG